MHNMNSLDQELSQALQKQSVEVKQSAQRMNSIDSDIALRGLSKPMNTDSTPGTGVATVFDKLLAVNDIFDMQEACMMNFIILGDLAKAIKDKNENFDGDKIEFGFRASQLTPEIESLFRTWKFEKTPKGYRYYYTPPLKWDVKVPVEITVFTRKYSFFENPDFGFYGTGDFKIPNPFDAYWKVRGVIR